MKRKIFVPLALVFLVALMAACQQEEPVEEQTVDPDTIALDTGIGSVTAEGRIVPLSSVRLAFQASGSVQEILVSSGDSVSAGDVLIRLGYEVNNDW